MDIPSEINYRVKPLISPSKAIQLRTCRYPEDGSQQDPSFPHKNAVITANRQITQQFM